MNQFFFVIAKTELRFDGKLECSNKCKQSAKGSVHQPFASMYSHYYYD